MLSKLVRQFELPINYFISSITRLCVLGDDGKLGNVIGWTYGSAPDVEGYLIFLINDPSWDNHKKYKLLRRNEISGPQ